MHKYLTEEQARKLREALRGHQLEAIITLALVTGMRRDELLSLQWQDLDLERRELRVLDSKTKSSHRMIDLPQDVTEMLKQHRLAQTVPHLDLVFPDRVGGFLRPEQLLQEFYDILEQAELPRLRFHDLRQACWRALQSSVKPEA